MVLSAIASSAIAIIKATGLYDRFSSIISDKDDSVAKEIVSIAQDVTGATDLSSVVHDTESNEYSEKVREALIAQETELYKLALANTVDARDMQVSSMTSEDKLTRHFIYHFAWFWSVITCSYIGSITFWDIPDDNIRFADVVLGFLLGTIIATIVQFFYGSMLKKPHGDDNE